MNKDKLILADGTTIELEVAASLGSMTTICESKAEVLTLWDQLTLSNVASISVQNGSGLTVGKYSNLVLKEPHVTATESADGTVKVTFGLREKTETELRLDNLEEGQETLMGAVGDLGEATSTIAEQLEGGNE